MEVDEACLNLFRLDYARVPMKCVKVCPVSEPIIVSDGLKDYKVMMLPMVSSEAIYDI